MEARDIQAILAIQRASPETAQWTMWDYERVARGDMTGWVAEEESKVLGFLVAREVLPDVEVLNLAVAPGARQRGTGASLLRAAIEWGKSFRATHAFLEVRASNQAALQFYQRHHFQTTGRRARYYAAPVEDAVVLALRLA
jgi:ribosomal-protein-alanine N-acetyltransferase